MNSQFNIPDAPPVPPEEGRSAGMLAVAAVNVLLALYLLFIAVAPVVWGQLIAGIEARARGFEQQTLQQDVAPQKEPEPPTNEALATYKKFRTVHFVVLVAAILVAIGLGRSAYLAVFYDHLHVIGTSSITLLAAVLFSTNWALGWGGILSLIAIVLSGLEAILLHVPAVQRILAGIRDDEEEED